MNGPPLSTRRRDRPRPGTHVTWWRRFTWIERFLCIQFACQILLLFESLGPSRIAIRIGALGTSLGLMVFARKRGAYGVHPSLLSAQLALGIVGLSVLRPDVNSFTSALAQFVMYVAILGPLFWVSCLRPDANTFRRALLLIWAFHALSALVAILQVYFPGHFQPAISSVVAADPGYLRSLRITLADGGSIYRPMGLTDIPGGAATSGFYSVLLGLAFGVAKSNRSRAMRAVYAVSVVAGLFCLYVCQVRSVLVTTAVCAGCFTWVIASRRRISAFSKSTVTISLAAVVALWWAASVGGESVTRRLETLFTDDLGSVYYRNRGHFLDYTIRVLLPEYPLGAGPGRWGTMSSYFGDPTNVQSPMIWAEIQWTGWLLDGGIPLIIVYTASIIIALLYAWRLASRLTERDELWIPAVFIVAYDLGMLAMTFSYPVFQSQQGMEFWLLNALLFSACLRRRRPRK